MERYARNAGAVFTLKYHLVWCPKYRRRILVPPVDKRLKELLTEIATRLDITIKAMEVMPDHVHLFLETDPRYAPAQVAARFKGGTSHALREEFKHLTTQLPCLWSRSYFISTIGSVSDAAITKYIANQKGR